MAVTSEPTPATEPTTVRARPRPQIATRVVEPRGGGWTSWITTVDHKRIGILYLFTTFLFFILGGVEALLMRIQLGVPDNTFLEPEKYNALFTMHGTTMVFLFVIPIMAGFANYLVPLMIGARDMAFPRLNAWSYWMLLFGGIVLYASLFFSPPECGWTCYAPLSEGRYSPSGGIDAWIISLHIVGLSSMLGAVNFVATITNMRAPGMGWGRLPLFCWTILIYAYMIILASPALTAALAMLLVDRHYGGTFFDPTQGGSALLWQHAFWFYSHPAVYIMVLPAFGIVSEVLPVFARKPIFGYKAIAASTVAIAFLGMLVWAHHMFATPMSTVVLAFFMLSSFLIAVPTGVKIFNWVATLWRGTIEYRTPLLFAVGLIGVFLIGGISGIFLAVFPVDWQLTDTYFVVAHLHYVLFGGSVFGIFAGIYYWFPKMSGRMLSEGLGKASFWTILIGFNLTFLVQHSAGLDGMPRRIYEYSEHSWTAYNLISSVGAFVLALGILLTVVNVARSLKVGRVAGPDPWKGNTLEWFTSSPPPENNFDVVPRVRSVEPMKDIRRQVEQQTGVQQRFEPGRPLVGP
ncbi:MAG: cytochrome c oxidase subunit I [Actinomycetota bacterium]|nr:cytochrome c oxidase subunit I [Actinomycetota bacterium]